MPSLFSLFELQAASERQRDRCSSKKGPFASSCETFRDWRTSCLPVTEPRGVDAHSRDRVPSALPEAASMTAAAEVRVEQHGLGSSGTREGQASLSVLSLPLDIWLKVVQLIPQEPSFEASKSTQATPWFALGQVCRAWYEASLRLPWKLQLEGQYKGTPTAAAEEKARFQRIVAWGAKRWLVCLGLSREHNRWWSAEEGEVEGGWEIQAIGGNFQLLKPLFRNLQTINVFDQGSLDLKLLCSSVSARTVVLKLDLPRPDAYGAMWLKPQRATDSWLLDTPSLEAALLAMPKLCDLTLHLGACQYGAGWEGPLEFLSRLTGLTALSMAAACVPQGLLSSLVGLRSLSLTGRGVVEEGQSVCCTQRLTCLSFEMVRGLDIEAVNYPGVVHLVYFDCSTPSVVDVSACQNLRRVSVFMPCLGDEKHQGVALFRRLLRLPRFQGVMLYWGEEPPYLEHGETTCSKSMCAREMYVGLLRVCCPSCGLQRAEVVKRTGSPTGPTEWSAEYYARQEKLAEQLAMDSGDILYGGSKSWLAILLDAVNMTIICWAVRRTSCRLARFKLTIAYERDEMQRCKLCPASQAGQ